MPKMNQTEKSYLANNGWSSNKFLEHAKFLFGELPKIGIEVKVGRTVVHLYHGGILLLKCYVHHSGNTADVMTITDSKGNELGTFCYSATPESILHFIKEQL